MTGLVLEFNDSVTPFVF